MHVVPPGCPVCVLYLWLYPFCVRPYEYVYVCVSFSCSSLFFFTPTSVSGPGVVLFAFLTHGVPVCSPYVARLCVVMYLWCCQCHLL